MILVDSSVWIHHLRQGEPALVRALEAAQVLVHPFVVGELACGHLKDRAELLKLLRALPQAPLATEEEALRFIEGHALMGRGIGYPDVHLLASVALAGTATLLTRDKRLAAAAQELGLAGGEPPRAEPVTSGEQRCAEPVASGKTRQTWPHSMSAQGSRR